MARQMQTSINGLRLDVHCEQIEVTSFGPTPDRDWIALDGYGHLVTWDSVEWVVADEWMDEDGDEYTEGEYRCRTCGEVVRPGMKPADQFRRFIPGMISITATDSEGVEWRWTGEPFRRAEDAPPTSDPRWLMVG